MIEPASPDIALPNGANVDIHPPRVNREEMNDEGARAPGKLYNRQRNAPQGLYKDVDVDFDQILNYDSNKGLSQPSDVHKEVSDIAPDFQNLREGQTPRNVLDGGYNSKN